MTAKKVKRLNQELPEVASEKTEKVKAEKVHNADSSAVDDLHAFLDLNFVFAVNQTAPQSIHINYSSTEFASKIVESDQRKIPVVSKLLIAIQNSFENIEDLIVALDCDLTAAGLVVNDTIMEAQTTGRPCDTVELTSPMAVVHSKVFWAAYELRRRLQRVAYQVCPVFVIDRSNNESHLAVRSDSQDYWLVVREGSLEATMLELHTLLVAACDCMKSVGVLPDAVIYSLGVISADMLGPILNSTNEGSSKHYFIRICWLTWVSCIVEEALYHMHKSLTAFGSDYELKNELTSHIAGVKLLTSSEDSV